MLSFCDGFLKRIGALEAITISGSYSAMAGVLESRVRSEESQAARAAEVIRTSRTDELYQWRSGRPNTGIPLASRLSV